MDGPIVCAHCGLPIPGSSTTPLNRPDELEYCCFGCRLAAELGQEAAIEGELGRTCLRLGLSIFCSLNVMIFTMWLWTQDVYGYDGANDSSAALILWNVCRYACLVFSLPVLWMLGRPVADGAWQSLRRGVPTTDILLLVGTLAAFLYSTWSTVRGGGPVYYEVGCAVLVLVTLGRWLEARGKQQAAAALESLEKLLPTEVRKLVGDGVNVVPLSQIAVGDRLVIRAGERIPTDATIVRGLAAVDCRVLTGESAPRVCEVGDTLYGGTLNLDGDLTIEVTSPPEGGTWQRLIDSMRAARLTKGRYQRTADAVSRWFMPFVAVLAIAAFVFHTTTTDLEHGLSAGLAVVLVACPCALGLATPLAVWAALGSAAKAQVLFRNGEALERLASVRVAAFDKTGTLTDGLPNVDFFLNVGTAPEREIIGRMLAATSASPHDLSRALTDYCRTRHVGVVPSCTVRTLPGRGLVADFVEETNSVFLGSARLMQENGLKCSPTAEAALTTLAAGGAPFICLGWSGLVQAIAGFSERLRNDVVPTITDCRALQLKVFVLTGDHAGRGAQLAEQLQVPVQAELLPTDKVAAITEFHRRHGATLMVGDGLNDAPALTAADVGIALGCGTDVSRQSADVCLLGNQLSRVPWAVGLARQTIRVVRQNLFWSFLYNGVGIVLAAHGSLNPIWAAVAMIAGGLSVVGNSLRLSHYPQPSTAAAEFDSPNSAASDHSLPASIS